MFHPVIAQSTPAVFSTELGFELVETLEKLSQKVADLEDEVKSHAEAMDRMKVAGVAAAGQATASLGMNATFEIPAS